MYELRFSKYGEGECKYCGKYSPELYAATVTQGEKSKKYVVCRECALNLKKQVESKNAQEKAKPAINAAPATCPVCGNTIAAGLAFCNMCGASLTQTKSGLTSRSFPSGSQNTADYSTNNSDVYVNSDRSYQQMNGSVSGSENQACKAESSPKMKLSFLSDNPKHADKYQKLGGSLIFFIVTLVFSCLSYIVSSLNTDETGVSVGGIFLFAVDCAFTFFIIKGLKERKGYFIRVFSIKVILEVLLYFIVIAVIATNGVDISDYIYYPFGDLIYLAAWLEYFEKSNRCGVYFGNREYLNSSVFTRHYYDKHYRNM